MARDHYKGVPKTREILSDRNNSLVIRRPIIGDLAYQVSPANVFDVSNFGTIANGTANDTSAIQAAIDAACSSSAAGFGGVVFFPPGVYKVTAPLTVYDDNVRIEGANRSVTRIQLNPDDPEDGRLLIFEASILEPLQYCGISNIEFRAAQDTTTIKYAIDLHGVRKFYMHEVAVAGWSDTSKSSVALRVRGWDNLHFHDLSLDADIPIVIDKNDDGAGGFLDETKDLDHAHFHSLNLIADNEDKIAFKIASGAVFRNLAIEHSSFVHGGFSCVDAELPRRRSTNLSISNCRFEGFAETDGDVEGKYAIDIRRHVNGQLRNVIVEDALLAEGADPRYGTLTPANWNGIRTVGVWRATLVEDTYSGGQIPITTSGTAIEIVAGQWTEEDFGKAVPECEAQWDQLEIARPRSWWKFAGASGSVSDQQDSSLGKIDKFLTENGSPGYQLLSDGWHGYQGGFTESSGQRFGLNTTNTEFSPQDRSAAWLSYYNFPPGWVPGGDRILITIGSPEQTGSNGPNVYINSSGRLEIFAGSTVVTGTVNYLGHNCAILPVYDRTGGTWKVYTATTASGIMETITGTYSASVGNSNPKGFGAPDTFTSCSGTIRFGAMWFDSGAEGLDETTLNKLGW